MNRSNKIKLRNKKTGKVKEFDVLGCFMLSDDFPSLYTVDKTYNSLAELNEEWEDYKPKEPLIKDKKIRKAVRAWAEMHGVKRVHYLVYAHNSKLAYIEDVEGDSESAWAEMDMISLPELKDLEYYTIAELCGEEEE